MQDMHGSNSFKLSQRNCIYHITPLLAVDLGVSQEEVYQFASFKEFSKKFLLPAQRFELSLLSIFSKPYKPCSSHFWVDPSGVCFNLATVSFRD